MSFVNASTVNNNLSNISNRFYAKTSETDFNRLTKSGYYFGVLKQNTPDGTTAFNWIIEVQAFDNSTGWTFQRATRTSDKAIFTRIQDNGTWSDWEVLAQKSDLSNFQFISANNFDDAWNKAAKNTMCFADITGNIGAPTQAANRWFAQIFKNDTEKYGWITTWSFNGGVYKKERNDSSSWTDWHS